MLTLDEPQNFQKGRVGLQTRDLDRRIVRFHDLAWPLRAHRWPESEIGKNGLDRRAKTWKRW
ncbi:hypothetical protein MTR_5g059020 [Medicago truncatula]|uniref:Uncharacterized protein n=1 Tax=Medicago truncatula TaxID=3880 RepID=G7K8V7_MEDTR|nr:hypothetical protein MTR_5g059020 [Medicago truncatula]